MIKLTKKSKLKTATWAGGTTTQLTISPPSAEYTKFNFDYRISYATVEVEESTFTFMPGVTRHLMILKGSLEIHHIDRYTKHLNKFDIDIFNGEWPTKAKGKVTDFNLMTGSSAKGKLESFILKKAAIQKTFIGQNEDLGIYLLSGSLQFTAGNKEQHIDTGDFLLVKEEGNTEFLLKAEESCEIIIARIEL